MQNSFGSFILPSGAFDLIIFSAIIGWFLFCLIAGYLARRSIPGRIAHSHFKDSNAGSHELMAALRDPFWDHVIDNGPGFALVIGLLGTFLGIGLAIQGAGNVLAQLGTASGVDSLGETVGQLSPMLSQIGLKFKSSAWGIIAHIALRVVIPLFKLDEIRSLAILTELTTDAQRAEELNRLNWIQVADIAKSAGHSAIYGKAKLEEVKVAVSLLREKKSLLEANGQRLDSLVRVSDAAWKLSEIQAKHLGIIAEVQGTFGKNVDKLSTTIDRFQATVESFDVSIKKSIRGIDDSVRRSGETISESVGKIDQSVDRLRVGLHGEMEKLSTVSASLQSNTRLVAEALNSQGEVLREMQEAMDRVTSQGASAGIALNDAAASIEVSAKAFGADGELVKRLDTLIDLTKNGSPISPPAQAQSGWLNKRNKGKGVKQ